MSVIEQRMSPFHKGTRKKESWDQQQTEIYTHTHTNTECALSDLEGGFGECVRREC